MRYVGGFTKHARSSFSSLVLGGVALLIASACNPLSGGKSGSEVSPNFIPGFTPSIPLEVRLTDMPSVLRGGQTVSISFSLPSEMVSGDLEYSSDGVNFTVLSALTPVDYTYSWSVPMAETLLGVLRIRVFDEYGRVNSVTSRTFIIDSTPPASPVMAIATSNPTNVLAVGLTSSSCTDQASIYVSESSTVPAFDAAGWQTCSESAGVITTTLAAGDGTKTLYFFAQDSVGNVSSASTASIVLDQTMPNLSLTSSPTSLKGGASFTVNWTASDALSGLSSFVLAYAADGTTFSTVANPVSTDTSYAWTAPSSNTSSAKLRLTAIDVAGNSRVVTSSAFTVDSAGPTLTLVSPSIVLKGGSTLAVSLSATDALSGVNSFKLQYASDGTTFSDVATLANSATSYSWTVPSDNTTTAKLKVVATDAAGNSSSLASSSFTIDSTAPTLTLSSLTGGQVVGGGVATSINWSGSDLNTGATPIKIEVSSDGGGSWSTLVAAMANSGSYSWTTPAVTSTTYRLRVTFTDAAGNSSASASTSNFSINSSSPITNVTSPNGGEVWRGGTSKSITWSSSGLPAGASTAKIEYSLDNGSTYTTIVSGLTNAAGSNAYSWSVPASTNSTQGLIRVTVTDSFSVDVVDVSDSAFAIDSTNPSVTLTSLTGGQTLSGGATSNITWTATDTNPGTNTVNLEYSSDSGTSWSPIASGLSNSGSYAWSVPAVTSTTYRVRVSYSDAAGNSSSSASSSNFRINSSNPVIAVTAPNGGEYLKGGDTTSIMWSSSDLPAGSSTADLDYTTDGTTWTSIATGQANSGTYSWTIPSINSTSVRVRVSVTDSFGVVTSDVSNATFVVDSTAPTLSLTNPVGPYRGGTTITVALSAADAHSGLLTFKFQYASNGTTFADVATLANSDTSYNWAIPSANVTTAKVRVYAVDASGNTATQTSNAFTIDSTAPSAPSATLASANPTNSTIATLTIASCTDRASIYVGNVATAPAYNAAGWQACSTGTGAITNTLTAGDATKTMYVFAQDAVGNVSTSSTVTTVLDQTAPGAPAIVFSASGTTSYGGTTLSSTMTVSSCTDRAKILISETGTAPAAGDAGWQNCVTTAGGIAYTLTSSTEGAHALKAWAKDAAGNISATATNLYYTYDLTPPTVTAVSINSGAVNVSTPFISVAVSASDTVSPIQIRLAEADGSLDCQAVYADDNWFAFSGSPQTYSYQISTGDGTKKVCAWAKDAGRNVSVISPSTGTLGVDMDTIEYFVGNPPVVTAFNVTNGTAGGNFGTTNFNSGDTVAINWTITDTEGLANQSVALSYTTDNVTWTDITGTYGVTAGHPTSSSSSYSGFTAPSGYFRLKIVAYDTSGNSSLSTLSTSLNTGPWSIFAGSTDRGVGGTGKAAQFLNTVGGDAAKVAIDPATNDIYLVDDGFGIKKFDAKTGLVSIFIAYGASTNLGYSGTLSAASRLLVDRATTVAFDKSGKLYFSVRTGGYANTDLLYQLNVSTLAYRRYVGGGTNNAEGAGVTPDNIFFASGRAMYVFDESNSLYFWTSCTPGTWTTTPSDMIRLMKLTQNPDGSPNALSTIYGGCVNGTPSGSGPFDPKTVVQPGGSYPQGRLVVYNNGDVIFFCPNVNSNWYKILNGNLYKSNYFSGGTPTYNPNDGKIYFGNTTLIAQVTLNTSGASGETSVVYAGGSTAAGCNSDGVSMASSCFSTIAAPLLTPQGKWMIVDGAVGGNTKTYRVRYFDSSNKVQTIVGTPAFYGNGLDKAFIRGTIKGIYWKKATEPNQAAFPAGLYFTEMDGLVIGHIDPTTNLTDIVAGSQWSSGPKLTQGATVDTTTNLGSAQYDMLGLGFDSQGLPWFKNNNLLVKIGADKKAVILQNAATTSYWQPSNTGDDPKNYGLAPYGTVRGVTLKGSDGVFLSGGGGPSPWPYSTFATIRFFDFTLGKVTRLIGDYSGQTANASSPNQTAGNALNVSLASGATGFGAYQVYRADQDRLYFTEGSVAIRYLTTPLNTATSSLGTLYTGSGTIYSFIFSEDNSQVFYLKSDGKLYCHDISSGKSWCNDTSLGPSTGMAVIVEQGNQFTWKDATTLLISTAGQIYSYTLPTGP